MLQTRFLGSRKVVTNLTARMPKLISKMPSRTATSMVPVKFVDRRILQRFTSLAILKPTVLSRIISVSPKALSILVLEKRTHPSPRKKHNVRAIFSAKRIFNFHMVYIGKPIIQKSETIFVVTTLVQSFSWSPHLGFWSAGIVRSHWNSTGVQMNIIPKS